ncbi:MAG: alginate lyase family protein [Pseudomonadota bacterium]
MQRLSWYLQRARVMTPREWVYRLGALWTQRRLAAAFRRTPNEPALRWRDYAFCTASTPRLPDLRWRNLSDREAQTLLDGVWPVLGFRWRWRDDPAVWFEAPDTGRRWPRAFYGAIDHRPGNPVGDVRVAWEPARLQQLVALALLGRNRDCTQAIALLERQLLSWAQANPPLTGVHYVSVMECGLRIVALCHALDLARDRLSRPDAVWTAAVNIVQQHAALIERRLSLYSSAGNHTVAEAAGLVYAGTLFPELPSAGRWCTRGLALLGAEAARQVLPDGGGAEQAFGYHRFVVDLLGLVTALCTHRQASVPAAVEAAAERGRRFLAAFASTDGTLPAVGDADDGFALSRYLAAPTVTPAETPEPLPTPAVFADAGYTVLRSAAAKPAVRVIVDHGPFGLTPLFGHAHADALALQLQLDDRAVLLDPGTFSYAADPRWRRYFRGTRAHNTVTVDGVDQAVQVSAFQWSQSAPAELVRCAADGAWPHMLLLRHRGYARRGVVHQRAVAFDGERTVVVVDELLGAGHHRLELNWHCANAANEGPNRWRIATPAGAVALVVDGGESELHTATENSPHGWRSPAYGCREPGFCIGTQWSGTLPHSFATAIVVCPTPRDANAAARLREGLTAWMRNA